MLIFIWSCNIIITTKSNLAFLKVVWQWKFGFVSLAFWALFS